MVTDNIAYIIIFIITKIIYIIIIIKMYAILSVTSNLSTHTNYFSYQYSVISIKQYRQC